MYHETRADLESAIHNYRNGAIDLDTFKSSVWKAASEVVSIEDKELRLFLQQVEAELDSLQFTVDEDFLFGETLKVANRIENYL